MKKSIFFLVLLLLAAGVSKGQSLDYKPDRDDYPRGNQEVYCKSNSSESFIVKIKVTETHAGTGEVTSYTREFTATPKGGFVGRTKRYHRTDWEHPSNMVNTRYEIVGRR